jgi:hypothetical protein
MAAALRLIVCQPVLNAQQRLAAVAFVRVRLSRQLRTAWAGGVRDERH